MDPISSSLSPLDYLESHLIEREAIERIHGSSVVAERKAAQLAAFKDLRQTLGEYLSFGSIDGKVERQALRAKLATFLPKS